MVALSSSGKVTLDNVAAKAAADPAIPSFVFGATTAEKVIYFKGAGYKIPNDPSSGEVDEDNVFWICSQTKMIVHLAALHLIERGELEIEAPVSDYLPVFNNPVILDNIMSETPSFKPATQLVLVKHLLNFSSGLFYPIREVVPARQFRHYSTPHGKEDPMGEFFAMIKGDLPGIPLQFEPGTDFAYGWSSDVLGFVVEKASGMTLDDYLKRNIFHPLGMKSSFLLTPDLKAKLVPLTLRKDGQLETWNDRVRLFERDPTKVALHLGGVGIYSSLQDYLTLLRHLLQIYAGTVSTPLLSQETVSGLFRPALTENGDKSLNHLSSMVDPFTPKDSISWSTALAVTTADFPSGRRKGSGFWSGWANTYHFIDPTTGIAAVLSTQLIPYGDMDVMKLNAQFEEALYKSLE